MSASDSSSVLSLPLSLTGFSATLYPLTNKLFAVNGHAPFPLTASWPSDIPWRKSNGDVGMPKTGVRDRAVVVGEHARGEWPSKCLRQTIIGRFQSKIIIIIIINETVKLESRRNDGCLILVFSRVIYITLRSPTLTMHPSPSVTQNRLWSLNEFTSYPFSFWHFLLCHYSIPRSKLEFSILILTSHHISL